MLEPHVNSGPLYLTHGPGAMTMETIRGPLKPMQRLCFCNRCALKPSVKWKWSMLTDCNIFYRQSKDHDRSNVLRPNTLFTSVSAPQSESFFLWTIQLACIVQMYYDQTLHSLQSRFRDRNSSSYAQSNQQVVQNPTTTEKYHFQEPMTIWSIVTTLRFV